MKRKLLCGLLCLILLLANVAMEGFAAKSNSEPIDWGLTLTVDDVTPTGMTLVMDQSGGNYKGQIEYCSCLILQVRSGGDWVGVPYVQDDVACDLDPDNVRPNAMTRMVEDWECLYGALPDGHYRYIKEFTEFDRDNTGPDRSVKFYVEFVITDPHTCGTDGDGAVCDICLAIMPHKCKSRDKDGKCDTCAKTLDVYRVVGNAAWMGDWDPASNAGRMKETDSDTFVKTFYGVQPGDYELRITKNGSMDESWGKDGGNCCFTLEEPRDVTVTFYARSAYITVKDQPASGYVEEEIPKTADLTVAIPVLLLLSCTAVLVTLRKRNYR